MEDKGELALHELNATAGAIIDKAKEKLREHFEARRVAKEQEVIQDLKRQNAYPFEDEPRSFVEIAERAVFDTYAASLNKGLSEFSKGDAKSKRFILGLVRQSLESNPDHLQKLIEEVVNLTSEDRRDLTELLTRTTLPRIISAAKLVADRLSFLNGLSEYLHDKNLKKHFMERRQLHRILAENTWIFGEEFNLTNDDEDLRTVLRTVLQEQRGKDAEEIYEILSPVREDGGEMIPDLVLGRSVPQARAEEREYLVVELKRPSYSINMKTIGQIKAYSKGVAQEPRIRTQGMRWTFIAVSTDITEEAKFEITQPRHPYGFIIEYETINATLWAKTWGDILNESRARLMVFQRELQITADRQAALAHMAERYSRYLPSGVTPHIPASG